MIYFFTYTAICIILFLVHYIAWQAGYKHANKEFGKNEIPDNGEKLTFKYGKNRNVYELIGPDGLFHKNKAEAMYFGYLELCGCGLPVTVHQFLINCLGCSQDLDIITATQTNKQTSIEKIEQILKEEPEIAAEFILKFFDSKNLIEHGYTIYNSWLTDRGKQFLEIGPLT